MKLRTLGVIASVSTGCFPTGHPDFRSAAGVAYFFEEGAEPWSLEAVNRTEASFTEELRGMGRVPDWRNSHVVVVPHWLEIPVPARGEEPARTIKAAGLTYWWGKIALMRTECPQNSALRHEMLHLYHFRNGYEIDYGHDLDANGWALVNSLDETDGKCPAKESR